jgi:predicted nucleic acid-binding protein
MGKRYLIDTNAIHDYLQELYPEKGLVKMDKVLAQEANISVISKIEILSYTPDDESFAAQIESFINNSTLYEITNDIIETTIELRKLYRLKIGDAIIAATTQVHGFTLVTNNERDFNRVKGLKILNPHKL